MNTRCLHSPLRHALAVAAVLALLAFSCLPSLAQDNGQTFTLNLRGAPVMAVIHTLLHRASQNFSVDPRLTVTETTSVIVKNAPLDQALTAVLARADPPLVLSIKSEDIGGKTYPVYHIFFNQPPQSRLTPAAPDAADPLNITERSGIVPFPPADHGASQRLTAAQAVQAARAFCSKIGQPVTAPGAATYPAPAEGNEEYTDFYWQPRWLVKFPSQATVQVVDASGIIAEYKDDTQKYEAPQGFPPNGQIVIRMIMSEREAMVLAKKAIAATGQLEGGLLDFTRNWDLTEWTLCWDRAFHGIPYKDEQEGNNESVYTSVNARTGRINSLSLIYPHPPLARARVLITQDQATQTARALLATDRSVPPNARHVNTILRVVRLDTDPAKRAYAAWIVNFLYDLPGQERERVNYIWVDSETGQVIADKHLWVPGSFNTASGPKNSSAKTPPEPAASNPVIGP